MSKDRLGCGEVGVVDSADGMSSDNLQAPRVAALKELKRRLRETQAACDLKGVSCALHISSNAFKSGMLLHLLSSSSVPSRIDAIFG